MKTFLFAAALLAVTASAQADATRFVTPRPSAATVSPARAPIRYAPYSRNTPRVQGTPLTPSRESSRSDADHVAPYSRNYPRTQQING